MERIGRGVRPAHSSHGYGLSRGLTDQRQRTIAHVSHVSSLLGQSAPSSIHADRTAGRLEITWADGHVTVYDTTTLRWLCPCAFCRGEAGLPGWLDSSPTLSAEQTRLVDVALVGGYAIAPTWGDGHHTGYYTYALLRDRCPCPECSERRGAPQAAPTASDQRHEEHA